MPNRGADSFRSAPGRASQDDLTAPRAALPDAGAWFGLQTLEPRLLMAAEIALLGGIDSDLEIAHGDTTPAFIDGTHFAGAFVADTAAIHAVSRTFLIKNLGGTVLGLSGNPRVIISGPNASDFTVAFPTTVSKLGWNKSTPFAITFNPTAPGVRTATVRIPNDDSNESNYTFTITGIGFDPAGSGTDFTPTAVTGGAYYYTLVPGTTADRAATTGDAIDINNTIFPVGAFNFVLPDPDQTPPITVSLNSSNSSQTLVSSLIGMRTGEQRIILLPANSGVLAGSALNALPVVYTAEMLSIHSGTTSPLPSVALTGLDDLPIANGDTAPSVLDGTNFGVTRPGQNLVQTFTLTITGDNFALLGNPNIQVSGPNASNFTAGTVTTVNSTTRTFIITFSNATAPGVYTALVTIPNNDPDQPQLTFTVRATLAPGVFDEAWYLAQNADVDAGVDNGIWASGYEHFVAAGQFEGRRANPIFDEAYYLAHNPDVAAAVTAGTWKSGFEHFAAVGQTETRRFSRYFDNAVYLRLNPTVAAAVTAGTWTSGFEQYCVEGAEDGNPVSPYFDEDIYLRENSGVQDLITAAVYKNGFIHFVEIGHTENRIVSPFFDEQFYLAQNADVDAAVTAGTFATGFDHFLEFGQYEHRTFTKFFDETFYLHVHTDVAAAVTAGAWASGFEHFIAEGQADHLSYAPLFDEAYYLTHNPDVAANIGLDWPTGLAHFLAIGRTENRPFSPYYNEQAYLAANPDVVDAINGGAFANGLDHYVQHGQFEGRTAV